MHIACKKHISWPVNWSGLLLFFVSLLTRFTFSQDYNFRNFTSSDGFTQSYVYSILQDERGYLWVGTENGLLRYNGFVFENFTTSDSLADNFISGGISDGENMWFGHINGGITYYNGKSFKIVKTPLADLGPVTHFSKGNDGRVWMSSYAGGLLKLSKGVIKEYSFKNPETVISFNFLDDNHLLVGTNTGLLHCRIKESGEIEIIRPVTEIPESKIAHIIQMRSGTGFYITTEYHGIYRLTYKKTLLKISKLTSDTGFDFTGIQCIYEDSRSDLWLGSFGNGLIKAGFSHTGAITKITVFNKAGGFITNNVKTICEDREGNIWSGNYGEGLTQITNKVFSVYPFGNDIYGNGIFSIYTDKLYQWIGTGNGLLKLDKNSDKIIKFYGMYSRLPKDKVTAIYSTDGKELWIGTEGNGVFRMETLTEKISKYSLGIGELENSVTVITGKKEYIWIGTKKGLCSINSNSNNIKWYSISQGGLPHNYIHGLYADNAGRLWISSHSNTLAYISEEKIHKFPVSSGNGILTFGPITEDADSRIWAGTNGNGIFIIDSDSVTNLTTRDGLLSDFCYSIICDNSNQVWVGHKDGLSKIRTTDFFVKPIKNFESKIENYQFNPNAIFKDQQGKIWFGTEKALISYNPSMDNYQSPPPVPLITSIKINDEKRDISNKITLKPGKYKIQIDFLAISLKEPMLVNYQFTLEGYDQWSENTKNTSITYNQLTEGNYNFILTALSGDGVLSENPLSISIVIKKPVWKKWWFYPIMALLLTMLLFIYIKGRENKFRVEKKILEEKVRERTYEIQSQKNEIEHQRDIIEIKNANITSNIRYASHIQNAVLPPIEFINKLLPDNFIFSKPKDIVSGDFYWITERNNKIIFAVADCTGHGVSGAFMSLLGITLLNEIVNIQGITRSDAIVTNLREGVIHALQQSRKDITTSDGMDIALCVLDKDEKKIQFTGAMSDLVYIRDRKVEVLKADRISVSVLYEDSGLFTMNEINYKKGDVFYLFSDGYSDQFGGNYDKKYLISRFYNTLLEIHELPVISQKETLEKKLFEWMKAGIQTDDITVMGIRL